MVHLLRPDDSPAFPNDLEPDPSGLAAVGGRLTCETVCEAYRKGLFPWTGEEPIPWYSPDPRLILRPGRIHVSRSLRKVIRRSRFEIRFDEDFVGTMRDCAETSRRDQAGTWITPNMLETYAELHARGVAHSVEAWQDGRRVGGLYGLTFGVAFFGESMFARRTDASKVALVALCERLQAWKFDFIDCQQVSRHLLSMGASPVPRGDYLRRLAEALAQASRHHPWSTSEGDPADEARTGPGPQVVQSAPESAGREPGPKPPRASEAAAAIRFGSYREALRWARSHPGCAVVRAPGTNGFIVKP